MFEPVDLKFVRRKRVKLPRHPVSSKEWKSTVLNLGFSLVERMLFDIRYNLEVEEIVFESGIKDEKYPENNTVKVWHYKGDGTRAVVVLPQRGSGYNFARLASAYLATHDIDAFQIETPYHGSRLPSRVRSVSQLPIDLESLNNTMQQTVGETRTLADIVKKEFEKVGILGISLGGIYSSIVYGIDDNVDSACLVMSGGDLYRLVTESNDSLARALRKAVERGHIPEEEVRRTLERIDPTKYTNVGKSDNLLMVSATLDSAIPMACSRKLREAWGYPNEHLVDAGHVTIVRDLYNILPMILRHYRSTLR